METLYNQRIATEIFRGYTLKDLTETKLLRFTDEEIEKIKNIIDNKELVSDGEKEIIAGTNKIVGLLTLSKTDDIRLGILFAKCYGSLNMICDSLFDEENDFRSKVREYLDLYKNRFGADGIHLYVQQMERADSGIGTFYNQGKIQTRIIMYREDYLKFIQFFVKIAEVEG